MMKRRGFLRFLGMAPVIAVPAGISAPAPRVPIRVPARIPGIEEVRAYEAQRYEAYDARYAAAHAAPEIADFGNAGGSPVLGPDLYQAAGVTPGALHDKVAEWKAAYDRHDAVKLELERHDSVNLQGMDARKAGLDATHNPYPDRSHDYYSWYRGWAGVW